MIRRILKAIFQSNSLVLISELFIVVLGIFIAFQVDRWWEDRNDRLQERQYILRLTVSGDLSAIDGRHEAFMVTVVAENAKRVYLDEPEKEAVGGKNTADLRKRDKVTGSPDKTTKMRAYTLSCLSDSGID